MHIICLTPLEPGVYNDHASDNITAPPDGWAYIPEDFQLPATFPRLGSLEAEEMTYTREVEVQKVVTKTREVETTDEDGNPITVTEEYKDTETVVEEREYTMMTVVAMTEGTLPEPTPDEEEPVPSGNLENRIAAVEHDVADLTAAVEKGLSL